MKNMKTYGAASVMILVTASLFQALNQPAPRLIYNGSPSAPIGWYFVGPKAEIKHGMQVAAFAPQEMTELAQQRGYVPSHIPLIKTVWAVGGQIICWKDGVLRVPNYSDISVLGQDNLGREMPQIFGCHRLKDNEFLLISDQIESSWDSRYFGPVNAEGILGQAKYLGRLKGRDRRNNEDIRYGKIKGGSAPSGLTARQRRGLHIFLGGALKRHGSTPNWAFAPIIYGPKGGANGKFTPTDEFWPGP